MPSCRPLACSGAALGNESVLRVTEAEQECVLEGVEARPVPSLLRGFSGGGWGRGSGQPVTWLLSIAPAANLYSASTCASADNLSSCYVPPLPHHHSTAADVLPLPLPLQPRCT